MMADGRWRTADGKADGGRREADMVENASLSDYLFEVRRGATPERLGSGFGIGALLTGVGLLLGPVYAGVTGLGAAIAGICIWARVNQIGDSLLDPSFGSAPTVKAKRLRLVGILALGVAAIGTLVFLYAFFVRFLFGGTIGTTGM
jgi:hypothetical protein